MTPISLTPDQIDAAHRFLAGVGEKTRARGEAYFRSGVVFQLEVYKRGVGFRGSVSGGALYRTKVRFEDGAWGGECSCPLMKDCKHAVAVLLAGLQLAGAKAETLPAEVAPRAAVQETFAEQVAARLGRKLTAIEHRLASVVDELFTQFGEARVIPETRLDAITGQTRKDPWSRVTVSVWPTPPQSPWEAWLYLAAYLRRHGLPCRPLLVEITDWAEVDALVHAWERREHVEKWRDWLQKAAPMRSGSRRAAGRAARAADRGRRAARGVQGFHRGVPPGESRAVSRSSSATLTPGVRRLTKARCLSGRLFTPATVRSLFAATTSRIARAF